MGVVLFAGWERSGCRARVLLDGVVLLDVVLLRVVVLLDVVGLGSKLAWFYEKIVVYLRPVSSCTRRVSLVSFIIC